ncbi:sugar-transfer associated ATP-grasp domain-containing protein [Sphingobium sp.]|uniref:sugar-transfer associated ATP-grasp domain-containing protein n=1 Tax=Sphingobium sp. TaxID=1912891 RepID=UPI002BE79F09|nr:sugar-transfer associated ATP-grasp domain-containing protein [Sphingobium sp.]HUD93080.1 sugar-transfer associated ATP-grasp domain-containing protein [Sphingobium sp.]
MLTIRAVPRRDDNSLLAAYHAGLRRHWPCGARALAQLLARTGQGGWSSSERQLLPDAVRQAGLSMRDRKGMHRLLNQGAFPFAANPLKNKQLFAEVAQAAGLPVAASCDPARHDLEHWLAGETDIIAKPSFRSKGQGVERFQRGEAGWYGIDGAIADARLLARLRALCQAGGVIQRRLPTHHVLESLSPGALPTLRVVTCLNEAGVPEACGLALRLSAGGVRPVDNFNAGNLVLGVDDQGRCLTGWLGGGGRPVANDRHPATGAAIVGTPVPDLVEALALAARAHLAFAEFTVIGWDVGLTGDGPVLIEGNWNPGTDILQLVTGQGLADMRLGMLYRHHLARLSTECWRTARVVEWDRRGR